LKPIIFSGPMVLAILDGSKTQHRVVVKPQPQIVSSNDASWRDDKSDLWRNSAQYARDCSPFGVPGDLLWVRETFSAWHGGMTDCGEEWDEVEGPLSEWGPHSDVHGVPTIEYAADRKRSATRWRPSIHMPRWASRITLRVVSVRVERLQDISETDAIAEGVRRVTKDGTIHKYCVYDSRDTSSVPWQDMPRTAVEGYTNLWDSLNKKHPWSSNPWVFVLDFERVEGGAA